MVLYKLGAAGKGKKSRLIFFVPCKEQASRPAEQLHTSCPLKPVLFGKPEQNKIFD